MSTKINLGLSIGILILFIIIIVVGYVYVEQTKTTHEKMNATLVEFVQQWESKQDKDNIRFNATLNGIISLTDQANMQGNKTLANQAYFRTLHEFNAESLAKLTNTTAPIK